MKGAADRADNDDDEKEWLALDPEIEQSKSTSVLAPLYDEHKGRRRSQNVEQEICLLASLCRKSCVVS